MPRTETLRVNSFTVTPTQPTGTQTRLTITDSANLLTTKKMIKAVLLDAMDQFLATNLAQLVTNGTDAVYKNRLNYRYDYLNKRLNLTTNAGASMTLTAITVTAPYNDVPEKFVNIGSNTTSAF